jgi:DNA-binding NarL/FixJ family response regulator
MSTTVFLIGEDESLENVITSLQVAGEIEVIGKAANTEEILTKQERPFADLFLLDMDGELSNISSVKKIRLYFPDIKLLLFTAAPEKHQLTELLEAGADGYIIKNAKPYELSFAIRKVKDGGTYISSELVLNLLAGHQRSSGYFIKPNGTEVKLSDKEMDVLRLIAEGYTNAQMAQQLFTSVRTIETRRKKLLDKTGTTNTATLIKFSVRNGLLN